MWAFGCVFAMCGQWRATTHLCHMALAWPQRAKHLMCAMRGCLHLAWKCSQTAKCGSSQAGASTPNEFPQRLQWKHLPCMCPKDDARDDMPRYILKAMHTARKECCWYLNAKCGSRNDILIGFDWLQEL